MTISSVRLGTAANVASTTTSSASAAFGAQTFKVRIATTAAINYRVGDGTPTAVTTDTLLPANTFEYVTVSPGQKIAMIGTGTVNITEVS